MTKINKLVLNEDDVKEAIAEWVNRQIIATGSQNEFHEYTAKNIKLGVIHFGMKDVIKTEVEASVE